MILSASTCFKNKLHVQMGIISKAHKLGIKPKMHKRLNM
jgi:hypothetical protein